MATNTNDFSALFRHIISRWCVVPLPQSVAAAEQVLRTQLHPSLFRSLNAVSGALRSMPFFRRMQVIDRVGVDTLEEVYQRWHPEALPIVQSYRSLDTSAAAVIAAVCDLTVLAAAFNTTVLHALYAAVISVQTEEALTQRFGGGTVMPQDVMVRQWQECQQHTASTHGKTSPSTIVWVDPIHIPVSSPTSKQWIRIPVQVKVYDPIEQSHDVVIYEPKVVASVDVNRIASVPLPLEHGVTMLVRLRDHLGLWGFVHRVHFFPKTLRQLFERSSGAPLTIGTQGNIRLHPLHFSSTAVGVVMPEDPVAVFRRRPHHLDIQRLHHDVQLTVLV